MSAKRSASPSADSTPAKIGKTARLDADFYNHTSESLARSLLGKVLVRILEDGTRLSGRIVDTEAYPGGEDQASHSHDGKKTGHNAALYMDPGTVYIHNTFGGNTSMYVTCKGEGASVMLRALEPLDGLKEMREARGKKKGDHGDSLETTDLCSGPAKLTQALHVNRADFNKQDLRACSYVWIEKDKECPKFEVSTSTRMLSEPHGEWGEKLWRYFIHGSAFLSVHEKEAKPQKQASHGHKPAAPLVPVEVNLDKIKAKHRLSTAFFAQSAQALSKALLGKVLVREEEDGTQMKCVIVETSAFPGVEDAASHSHDGQRTGHNAALYLEPGTIYIHNTFGGNCSMYICSEGEGAAVLLRALEPREGKEEMRVRRGAKMADHGAKLQETDLCSGPAKLTQALGVKRDRFNKQDLRVCDFMWLEEGDGTVVGDDIVSCHRVGIDSHGEWAKKPWRYYIRGNHNVSQVDKTAEKAK